MSPTRVLITGGAGLLGRPLIKIFNEKSWVVLGLAFSRTKGNLKKLDICDFDAVKNLINEFKPNVIIHSAAQRQPDKVDKEVEETYRLNVSATKNLARAAADVGAFILYISTDYVFDGTEPPYKEDAEPNPLNNYGKTKLDGEKVVQAVNQNSAILRVSILYGDVEYLAESAVPVLFEALLNKGKHCKMSDYERRFPINTEDVAQACFLLADKNLLDPNVTGIFHLCGSDDVTKYDMVKVMADIYNLPMDHIEADNNPSAGVPRPYNSQLNCSKFEHLISLKMMSFKDGIKKCLDPYYENLQKKPKEL